MIALLFAAALAVNAPPADRRAVDVRTNGDDGLTQRLSDALTKSLDTGKRIRAMGAEDDADLSLAIIGKVTADGARFVYMVDLLETKGDFAPKRLASMTGKCRETALDACASDIVAKADRKVKG